jgi:hypothetical protein
VIALVTCKQRAPFSPQSDIYLPIHMSTLQHYKHQSEVLEKGEALYLNTLKQELEKSHDGEYVAIDVETGTYVIEPTKLGVITHAKKEFGDKLFYMVQIGNLLEPTANFRERHNVALLFS